MSISDSGHRGAQASGLFNQPGDRRITDLAEELQMRDPGSSNHESLADPHRTLAVNVQRFNRGNPIVVGTVVQSFPYLNWYKVLLGEANSFIGCSMGAESSFLPLGVRSTSPIPPYSNVLVFLPQGLTRGIILCVLPEEITEGKISVPDWLQQGGGSGLKREDAHQQAIKNMFREGGVKDFSSHRPLDATGLEWGKLSETGIGIMIDSFQAYLRVNEACGLFLNYFDSYTRLAGVNLDIQSYARQIESREDEGELQYVEGNIIYPWEATGCYSHGTDFTHDFPANDVQYKIPRGKIDLAEGEEDLQAVFRGVEYGGYLGQGYLRFMNRGAKENGKRQAKDEDPDYGLWQEHVALDGSYTMRSAKSVYLGKRVLIPVPRRLRLREDQQTGDDARKSNYKFSSQFGGGDEHKVGDVKIEGDNKHLRRVAGVLDLLTYNYNWKSVHAFHYHKKDYKLHDESKLNTFNRATDNLNFGELSSQDFMTYPSPKTLKIDHRYGDVDYFQRESFLAMHEDGSISIGDGYGSQIVMSGGQVRIEAPGDVMLLPGKRLVALAWDIILRSKNSVDISASEKDVRIKAEKNMQLVAGNGGQGGLLLESKSTGQTNNYDNVYGEEVNSSGIVLLAKQSEVATLAGDIYLRTGGGTLRNGDITLDAAKGDRNITYYGNRHSFFAGSSLDIWHSPSGESGNMVHSHQFSSSSSKIDGNLTVEKNLTVTAGNITAQRNIMAKRSIIAVDGNIVQKKGIFVGEHKGKVTVDATLDNAKSEATAHVTKGDTRFTSSLVDRCYATGKLGSDQLLQQIGFSFRDPPSSADQYKATQFKLMESRWQQMARNGSGSGGTAWSEKAVSYQGTQTYPFPGKQKLVDENCLLQYEQHTLFDETNARSKDRAGSYEDPKLSDWKETKIDGNYKLIL